VLDPAPGPRAGPDRVAALVGRAAAQRDELPALLVAERGAVPAAHTAMLTGSPVPGGDVVGAWTIEPTVRERIASDLMAWLAAFHGAHPLEEGAALGEARRTMARALAERGAPTEESLIDALLDDLDGKGTVARSATSIRLATHQVDLGARRDDVDRLLAAVSGEREATPPTVKELLGDGLGRDVIDAAARAGLIVRLSPEMVVAPSLVDRAVAVVRAAGSGGITLSALRESIGTSRKYAVPLAEYLDRAGFTRREGDLRFPRS
jgi:selenocysteine-specific elongation factor